MFTYSLLGVFLLVGCWRPAVAMEDLDSILHKVGHEIQEVRDHLVSLHHRLHNLLDLAHRGIAHASKIKKIANDNKDKPGHVCEIDVSDEEGGVLSVTTKKCPDKMVCDKDLRPLANEEFTRTGGVANDTDIYSIKYCRPKNMLNFLHFWFPLHSVCSSEHRDLMAITEKCEKDPINVRALCVAEHICDMFEESVNDTYPEVPPEGNLHEDCMSYVTDCEQLALPEMAGCMHQKLTKKLVCYGLNKAHIADCESAVDRCSLYEDHKDVIRCGGRELLKECAGLKDEPLTLCVERFVDYTCKNQKKKGKDKRDCKLETMEMALARLDMEKKRPKAYGRPYG